MTDALAISTMLLGVLGLSLWAIGIADHLYRLGWQQGVRRRRYDRLDNSLLAIGGVCNAGFVIGLYLLVLGA